MTWYVYMLRCADGSLYTGVATDVNRRVHQHNFDNRLGAAYTRGRRPVKVVYTEPVSTRSLALKREYRIRRLSRQQKETLIYKATVQQ